MFKVQTEANEKIGLSVVCEQFVNQLWIPDHLLPHEREHFAMDYFLRTVQDELKMLEIRWESL